MERFLKRKSKIYRVKQDWSSFNKDLYKYIRQIGRKRSTFSRKKALKDRELKFKPILSNVLYSGGLCNSLEESKHLILNGKILVNNIVVKNSGLIVKSGDIIKNESNKSLIWYYCQKWNSIELKESNEIWIRLKKLKKEKILISKLKRYNYKNLISSNDRIELNNLLMSNSSNKISDTNLDVINNELKDINKEFNNKNDGLMDLINGFKIRHPNLKGSLKNIGYNRVVNNSKEVRKYRKYKYIIPNTRISRLSYNMIMYI